MKDTQGNEHSFGDNWNSREEYLDYIGVHIYELKRILKDTGSIFLHCDEKASHYLRIMLGDVFGEENFRSEIIWTYKRWSNSKKDCCQVIRRFSFIQKQIIINLILFIQNIPQLPILTKFFRKE